mmetsp:Transcript_62358/g.203425  ORF Transcript_62358/g.203425 Transcript_62358/m.203425 type:complete len:335 (-) Transcript_62358:1952-2956(-)
MLSKRPGSTRPAGLLTTVRRLVVAFLVSPSPSSVSSDLYVVAFRIAPGCAAVFRRTAPTSWVIPLESLRLLFKGFGDGASCTVTLFCEFAVFDFPTGEPSDSGRLFFLVVATGLVGVLEPLLKLVILSMPDGEFEPVAGMLFGFAITPITTPFFLPALPVAPARALAATFGGPADEAAELPSSPVQSPAQSPASAPPLTGPGLSKPTSRSRMVVTSASGLSPTKELCFRTSIRCLFRSSESNFACARALSSASTCRTRRSSTFWSTMGRKPCTSVSSWSRISVLAWSEKTRGRFMSFKPFAFNKSSVAHRVLSARTRAASVPCRSSWMREAMKA